MLVLIEPLIAGFKEGVGGMGGMLVCPIEWAFGYISKGKRVSIYMLGRREDKRKQVIMTLNIYSKKVIIF